MSLGGREGYNSDEARELDDIKTDLASSAESVDESLGRVAYASAPSSPSKSGLKVSTDFCLLSVKQRISSLENLADRQSEHLVKMTVEDDLRPFIGSRAAYKGKITATLKGLKTISDEGKLNEPFLQKQVTTVTKFLDKIEEIEMQMAEVYEKYSVKLEDAKRKDDIEKSVKHQQDVTTKLAEYELALAQAAKAALKPDGANTDLVEAMMQFQGPPGQNTARCQRFDGGKVDKHDFKRWLSQFETMLASSKPMADKFKLSALRNHLTHNGLALKVISELEMTDDNYEVALGLLREEFLDLDQITDELLKEILNKNPKLDSDFEGVRLYVAEIRSILNDLKKSYKTDLRSPGTGGYKLVSSIIYAKLPSAIQRELIAKVDSNYPTMDHIFDNIKAIIKTLNQVKPKKSEPPKSERAESNKHNVNKNFRPENRPVPENKPALENFATSANRGSVQHHCKFCDKSGHTSYYCTQYKTREQRVERCTALKLCFRCTSNKHSAPSCPGKTPKGLLWPCKVCKSRGHIAAMCHKDISTGGSAGGGVPEKEATVITDVCFSTGVEESPYLLPIISLKLRGHNGQSSQFNFLFDTASQRSYLSHHAFDQLGCNPQLTSCVEFEVKTFLGSSKKKLREVNLDVFLSPFKHHAMLMLVDDQFDISLNVKGLKLALNNLRKEGYDLAANFDDSDTLSVHGLIGVDIIQFLGQMQMFNCMNGSAWRVSSGVIPFGNINNYLHHSQIVPVKPSRITNNNFNSIMSSHKCPSTLVNFVLEPKLSYDDPFETFFDDSLVERRIDKMLSCESLGIDENQDSMSDYDAIRVEKFKNSIELINGEYHIDLSWHDNIDQVPSNEGVALHVLDRVMQNLEKKGKLDEYIDGIKKWEDDNIVEKIEVDPKDFKNYVWIPHRPVFKTDEQSTTKMRPVFNCSLKTKGGPSLNEASYAGINLMKDMLELLMLFRTNKYVYLADIRKAFLMIKLKSELDRNRFCFFMKEGDKLVCYRFTTIIFGFNASPFILNYVIKHHASLFAKDDCSDMLLNNFFVDNLVKSNNDENKLCQLYEQSVERMTQGGFDLRSCNTNSKKLKNLMIRDKRFVEHGCEFEKVLGYKYSPSKDVIKLADSGIDLVLNLITKRIILSQFSKVFDPLALTSPVTIRGKILLSDVWKKKRSEDHWDEEVDGEDGRTWTTLSKDLVGLSAIEFPRYSLSEDEPADIFFFCDASKKAYGFVCYAVQNGKSCFLLSKSKVAPLKPKAKTLPVLELLGVFLAFKGLFSLLKTLKGVKINNIYVAVDAQVVLTWLLTDIVKTKNQFTRNRIRDVHRMKKEIFESSRIPFHFKYVPTKENPGDMLTRGLTLEQFKSSLDFWVYGPKWIQTTNLVWPSNDLNCLSESSKSIVCSTQLSSCKDIEPIVAFDRYSKFNKLLGVTARVLEFLSKFRIMKQKDFLKKSWGSNDPRQCAKVHLFKVMQSQSFPTELEYLSNPNGKKVPNLVNNLNLVFDEYGVLRSDGRSGKCNAFEFDLVNPILLAKDHNLTKLIIEDCHYQCQHLGIGSTLTKVRMSGFWIPRIRQAVKNVLSSCPMCKKFNSLSFKYPKVTNLPKHRVNFIKPYQHVGIDYTGSIFVKDSKGFKKMYLLIFTCLNVRAVHIELVPDMNTNTLVLAIIRFTNIYGIPTHIYSDNAKSFIAGCDVMKEIFMASEFSEHYSKYNIKHIRIPAYSAWVGSTWERMIRVIKSCLYKVIGRATMGYYKLLTILSDVQNAVNSRPLTYRCSDDNGLEIITPNCFIRPYVSDSLLFNSNDESILTSGPPTRHKLVQSLAGRDKVLEQFRQIWYEEYLVSLREQWKDLHEVNYSNKLRPDDIVLVRGPPDKKRPNWRLGRVLELFPGDDGKVRSAKIKRADGEFSHHSINHLYPLELALTHDHVAKEPDHSVDQRAESSSLVIPGVSNSEVVAPEITDLVTPNNLVSHNINESQGSFDEHNLVDLIAGSNQSLNEPFVEDGEEVGEMSASPLLVNEQALNPVTHTDPVILDEVSGDGVAKHPSGRPKRAARGRGKPMDAEYVYYD